jgi:putative Mg2+ transporter-C (MgtC) family protein
LDPAVLDQIYELLLRLGMATVLGGLLGIDRDLHHKPAGIRVLALVGLGGAAITMVSVIAAGGGGPNHPADGLLRTVQGVLSGIGFLGAGVIMRAQGSDEIHGITTAATIWVAAILGMICGMGQLILAIGVFLIAWLILVGGRFLEKEVLMIADRPKPPPKPTPSDATKSH